jgi:hypothetical protein
MSARAWWNLITHFLVGFVTGYLAITIMLWIIVRLGHALLWILLLVPSIGGLYFATRSARRAFARRSHAGA